MDELQAQIAQMRQALECASAADKPALLMMISQLEELVQPSHAAGPAVDPQVDNLVEDDDDEDEFLRFQREIASLDDSKAEAGTSTAEPSSSLYGEDDNGNKEKQEETEAPDVDIKEELSALEGMKCKAPHQSSWGRVGYYNAIVLNVEESSGESLDTIMVRVLFSQPVTESMLPCPYFMDGKCRFDDDSCKFSHGEVVPLSELREYSEPDFSTIKAGSRVLAKYSDGLWYKASITEVLETAECKIKYDSYEDSTTIALHDAAPLYDGDEDTSSLSSDSDEDGLSSSSSEEDDVIQEDEVRNMWMFQMKATGPLGEWEKHTKGIGSKLMAKMGYVVGTGLGPRGDGRVEPVDAVVLPRGRSLDACMELKEKAGNGSLFSAEKRLERIKQKQEQRQKHEEAKQKSEQSVFNFLNTTLSKPIGQVKKNACAKKELTKESRTNLNKKMLNLGQTMKQVTSDISRLRESVKRHQGKDDATAERFKLKLEAMEKHLHELKRSEENVLSEQRFRSDKTKLSIF